MMVLRTAKCISPSNRGSCKNNNEHKDIKITKFRSISSIKSDKDIGTIQIFQNYERT